MILFSINKTDFFLVVGMTRISEFFNLSTIRIKATPKQIPANK